MKTVRIAQALLTVFGFAVATYATAFLHGHHVPVFQLLPGYDAIGHDGALWTLMLFIWPYLLTLGILSIVVVKWTRTWILTLLPFAYLVPPFLVGLIGETVGHNNSQWISFLFDSANVVLVTAGLCVAVLMTIKELRTANHASEPTSVPVPKAAPQD